MLTLKNMQMQSAKGAHEDDVASLTYDVTHNVFGTTVTLPLTLKLTVPYPKVMASLAVADAEGETVEAALNKVATWCERAAAGIRESTRKPGADLPLFTRPAFEYETLAPWQKTLYDKLVADLRLLSDEDTRDYIRRQREEHNPILYVHDALDCARAVVYRERENEE